MANDFTPIAEQKNLIIKWPSTAYAVHSDRELIVQILRNLISNAIRYSKEGEITISCESIERELLISIIDTGIGIAAEDQDAIFEEFNQIENSERDGNNGLGLGLAIVDRTAKLLEHSITVESQLGKGSTFTISIPQVDIDESIVEVDTALAVNVEDFEDLLIVVIDDDISILEGTCVLFESWGCETIIARDEGSVLTQIKDLNRTPDGIIADYNLLNNETGLSAIQSIEEQCGISIPSLIISGDYEVKNEQYIKNSGIQLLQKPVSPLKLLTFIRNILKQKQRNNLTRSH